MKDLQNLQFISYLKSLDRKKMVYFLLKVLFIVVSVYYLFKYIRSYFGDNRLTTLNAKDGTELQMGFVYDRFVDLFTGKYKEETEIYLYNDIRDFDNKNLEKILRYYNKNKKSGAATFDKSLAIHMNSFTDNGFSQSQRNWRYKRLIAEYECLTYTEIPAELEYMDTRVLTGV